MISKFIKSLLFNLIDEVIYKWNNSKPFRTVMINCNYCKICNKMKKSNQIFIRDENSYNGRIGRIGWIYCDSCKIFVDLAEFYHEKKSSFIYSNKCNVFSKNKFKFKRISSNSCLKPYIQKECTLQHLFGDIFIEKNSIIYDKTRIACLISWEDIKKDTFMKRIPLASLIFYNRSIFKFNYNNFPIKNLINKWISLLKNEYNLANEWYVFNKINLPNDLKIIIFKYWNSLHIF